MHLKIVFLLLLLCGLTNSNAYDLSSPQDKLKLEINPSQIAAQVHFNIQFQSQTVFTNASTFLIDLNGHCDQNFAYQKCSAFETVNDSWKDPLSGESITNIYTKKEYFFTLKDSLHSASQCVIEFRVFENAVAYRFKVISYRDAYQGDKSYFPYQAQDSAWWMPKDCFAFEGLYQHSLTNTLHKTMLIPFLGHRGDSLWYSIHEAALLNYPLFDLAKNSSHQLETVLRYEAVDSPLIAKHFFQSPWRVISLGNSAAEISNSKTVANLNEPCKIKNTAWIKPIKFNGIWWEMHEGLLSWQEGKYHGASTDRSKEYIIWAQEHHLDATLTEGWNRGWNNYGSDKKSVQQFNTPASDFDWEDILKFAAKNKINWIAHHETQADYKMYDSIAETLFKDLHHKGVHYLKTGYAGVGMQYGQTQIEHFQKIVELAAKYEICLDVHESIMPSGIERTWPNLLTQEAGRGNEWNATYEGLPPYYATLLPFTRNMLGAFDYTPGILNLSNNSNHSKRGFTTLSHELALNIVLYSPMRMLAQDIVTCSSYRNDFVDACNFMAAIPPVWQERKVIAARPGDYVVTRALQVENKDSTWYIGAIADEKAYQLHIPLDFLEENQTYIASVYCDNQMTNWNTRPREFSKFNIELSNKDSLILSLAKAGGATVKIIKRSSYANQISRSDEPILSNASWRKMNAVFNSIFQRQNTFGYAYRKDTGAIVRYYSMYDSAYQAAGITALTDGKISFYDFKNSDWQGFYNKDLDVLVRLPRKEKLNQVMIHCLASPDDWIYFPRKVSVIVLDEKMQVVKSFIHEYNELPKEANGSRGIEDLEISLEGIEASFIKVKAYNPGPCPADGKGAGNPSWIFCDEILWR